MDSGTALIAPFMIFSIGTTTVSGLNFNPYLLYWKGEQSPFFAPPRYLRPSCRDGSDFWKQYLRKYTFGRLEQGSPLSFFPSPSPKGLGWVSVQTLTHEWMSDFVPRPFWVESLNVPLVEQLRTSKSASKALFIIIQMGPTLSNM